MDEIILGFLLLQPRTIYQIRAKFADGLNLMYSSSMGSIQAALKKLLSQGCITCTETVENGKYKKFYEITDSGRAEFTSWVNSPFKSARNKNPELAKLYFMGLSDVKERCSRIDGYVSALKTVRLSLETIYADGVKLTPPDDLRELFRYQLLTVKYGLDLLNFEIEWFMALKKDESEKSGA